MKATIFSSGALALALTGDTFLYAILPSNPQQLHVPLLWVGFILSVNRFARLLLNPFVVTLFERYGVRKITIAATICAFVSTLCYGFAGHLLIWILARLVWAFSFAALRLSSLQYAMKTNRRGFYLGLSRGIQETGPVVSLLLAPLVLRFTNIQTVFLVLAIITAVSVYLAMLLPETSSEQKKTSFSFNPRPSVFNGLTFVSSFLIDGMLVVVLGALLLDSVSASNITAMVAAFLALRRLSLILCAPLAGFAADYKGLERIFSYATVFTIVGILLIAAGFYSIGIIIAFVANNIGSALTPGNGFTDGENMLRHLSINATWRDIGAACGTLAGGLFLSSASLHLIFLLSALVLALSFLLYTFQSRLSFALFYYGNK